MISKQLARDVCQLKDMGLITEQKGDKNGYTVSVLKPSSSAEAWINDVMNRYPKQFEAILKIVKVYQNKRLIDVLHDVYYLYPQYAVNSKIKAEVGRQIYESDSYLNPEYDNSSD